MNRKSCTLIDYLLEVKSRSDIDCGILTKNESLKHRIDENYPEISNMITVEPQSKTFHLRSLIEEWMNQQTVIEEAKVDYYIYEDIIAEAQDIVKTSYGKPHVIVTNNKLLKMTITAMLDADSDAEVFVERDLWVQSAHALFGVNRTNKISHCCNHPWFNSLNQSSLFTKNHVARRQIIGKFRTPSEHIHQASRYKFSHLAKIHHDFLVSVCVKEVKPIFPEDQIEIDLMPCEYIKIVTDEFAKRVKLNDVETKILIVDTDEMHFVHPDLPIWIAGVSCEDPINPLIIKTYEQISRISCSKYQNGQMIYPQSNLNVNMTEKRGAESRSYYYTYEAPKPKLEYRNNSIATNHITKLLNNPHNFYVENILKLKPCNFHANHIVGIIVHSIFEELINKASQIKSFEEFSSEVYNALVSNYFTKSELVLIWKKTYEMSRHIWKIIENSEKLLSEHEGIQTIVHNNAEFFLYGRADLLYKKDGNWGIIDFKTGTPPSWLNIIKGSAPQIAIGILMLRFGGFLGESVEEVAESGFISPKGMFVVNSNTSLIQSAIDGIKSVIIKFWEEQSPYYIHINDPNWPYRCIARSVRR